MTELALRHPVANGATDRTPGNPIGALVARIGRAIADGQRRRAEREIAHLIGRNGGVMSDEVERRIERHLFG